MPATLAATQDIVARLRAQNLRRITLLVVPDTGWTSHSLDALRALLAEGVEPAGHGWRHKADRIRGIAHRLHSLLISRDVAEHLALTRDEASRLVARCHRWFVERELPPPELYVPPAWAMGRLSRADLDRLPFRRYEYLTGVYDSDLKRQIRTPMVGFEADTAMRAAACRLWNSANLWAAGMTAPLRVAIHPRDFELCLGNDLERLLNDGGRALSYSKLALD